MSTSCTKLPTSKPSTEHWHLSDISTNSKQGSENITVQYYASLKKQSKYDQFLARISNARHDASTRSLMKDQSTFVQTCVSDLVHTLEQHLRDDVIMDFLQQIKMNDFDSLIRILEKLKNERNYEKIMNITNNLDLSFQIEKFTIGLPLKKIVIEDFQNDFFIIKSLVSKLMQKEDHELKQQLANKIQDITEKFERRSAIKIMLDELEMSEDELEKEMLNSL